MGSLEATRAAGLDCRSGLRCVFVWRSVCVRSAFSFPRSASRSRRVVPHGLLVVALCVAFWPRIAEQICMARCQLNVGGVVPNRLGRSVAGTCLVGCQLHLAVVLPNGRFDLFPHRRVWCYQIGGVGVAPRRHGWCGAKRVWQACCHISIFRVILHMRSRCCLARVAGVLPNTAWWAYRRRRRGWCGGKGTWRVFCQTRLVRPLLNVHGWRVATHAWLARCQPDAVVRCQLDVLGVSPSTRVWHLAKQAWVVRCCTKLGCCVPGSTWTACCRTTRT